MREILFRGRHIHVAEENQHLDQPWVYGYLCDPKHINSPELEGDMMVDSETIGQYTGLKDKDGKRIFEGDIITITEKPSDKPFTVEWDPDSMKFVLNLNESTDQIIDFGDYYWGYNVKVIGNIFDNPELIEEVTE